MMTNLIASVLSIGTFGNSFQSFASTEQQQDKITIESKKQDKKKNKKVKEPSEVEKAQILSKQKLAEEKKIAEEKKKAVKKAEQETKNAEKLAKSQAQELAKRQAIEKTYINFEPISAFKFTKHMSNGPREIVLDEESISIVDYKINSNKSITFYAVIRHFKENTHGQALEGAFEEKLKKVNKIDGYELKFENQKQHKDKEKKEIALKLSIEKKPDILISAVRSTNFDEFLHKENNEGILEINISWESKCADLTNINNLLKEFMKKRIFSPIALLKIQQQLKGTDYPDLAKCTSVAQVGKGFCLILETKSTETYPYVSVHFPKGELEIRNIYPCEYAMKKSKCGDTHNCGSCVQGIKTEAKEFVGFNLKTKNRISLNPSKDSPTIFGDKVKLFTNQPNHQERLFMGTCDANVVAKKILKPGVTSDKPGEDQYANYLFVTKNQKIKGKNKEEQIDLSQVFKKFGQAFHEYDYRKKEKEVDYKEVEAVVNKSFGKEVKKIQVEESQSVSTGVLAAMSVVGATAAYTGTNAALETDGSLKNIPEVTNEHNQSQEVY